MRKANLGKEIIKQFAMMGMEIQLKKTIESTRFMTYYYNMKNPLQILKVTPRVIEVIKDFNKKNIIYTKPQEYSFALSIQKDEPDDLSLLKLKQPTESKAMKINIGLGMQNQDIIIDFDKTNHMLIAGATGSGKSVFVNSLLYGLINNNKQENYDLKLIDPKRVSFNAFKGLKNVELITEVSDASDMLEEMIAVMESRYEYMEKNRITDKNVFKPIFIVVDELSELMMTEAETCESKLIRLLQKARQANIHIILATQRPTKDVVNGSIKAQCDTRVCLKMASQRDSMTVIDKGTGQTLLGRGDGLIKYPDRPEEIRFQTAYVSEEEIQTKINELAHVREIKVKVVENTVRSSKVRQKIQECTNKLKEWGFEVPDISWKEEFSDSWLGLTKFDVPCIILNDRLYKTTDQCIEITIYHELGHCIAGKQAMHGEKWRAVMDEITKHTGLIFREKAIVTLD